MAEVKKESATKMMVGEVRFSYANVHTPGSFDDNGNDEAYSVVLLVPKSNTALKAAIDKCIALAKEEGKKSKWGGKIPPNLKITLHDGDTEASEKNKEVYKGHWFLNARNTKKPGILIRNATTKTNEELMNKEDFYSGCYGYATVQFFPFNKKSNGIGCSLQNLLKTRDGERLAGGASAEEDFASFEDTNDDMM